MCLAVPAKIIKVNDRIGEADFGGVVRGVRLDLLEDVKVGEYVLVHVGFAIERIDEKEAEEFFKIWGDYGTR
ncbi:MAG TPA: HypC/HybG/HupF family hydrogenase formation chaperone [Candidatus Syntrophoarchaeum butanivorans]|uniref:Hydrogenase expression/formation protein, HypC n=1 Tax=Candidatus Syntropharchaeum butanivorans TaxID=1839936 RepID=A0A1F2P5A9_9EURY|nr:MAG: hydrogenase expression/formation protein, HypC [Candidatus Syntrophoarchaeum butanivorans]HDM36694.1 HypC/HybG/HupF family hydrogenase formation chaperone [Candidatus Syntrophoarchaeum butanivorans]HEC56903.1 HypC/HybG/HupF family hydrogenase formation chaperone [Candidatus Syntrophoarchaeum butanivorans]